MTCRIENTVNISFIQVTVVWNLSKYHCSNQCNTLSLHWLNFQITTNDFITVEHCTKSQHRQRLDRSSIIFLKIERRTKWNKITSFVRNHYYSYYNLNFIRSINFALIACYIVLLYRNLLEYDQNITWYIMISSKNDSTNKDIHLCRDIQSRITR